MESHLDKGADGRDLPMTTAHAPRIGFVGSMNAMPMAYALKFRRDGYDVRYVVEAAADNHLMRPEHQYAQEVSYPYPPWVVEIPWRNDLPRQAFAPWTHRRAIEAMSDRDIVLLNDSALALGAWMPQRALCVALSSGADVDVFCRWEMAWALAASVRRKWLWPVRLGLEAMRTAWHRKGLARCEVVSYFPQGLNPAGDAVLEELGRRGHPPRRVERYDVNFAAAGVRRIPLPRRSLSKILVPVRMNLRPPPGGEFEYKGNDLILRALARYRRRQSEIEVHLFEKGLPADIALARQLCRELSLEANVVWHRPVPLPQLLALYADSDLVFDQVGRHWMGAIGCYALYMGRPLIANARLDVFGRLWGTETPILDACTEDEIYDHLVRCEDRDLRERLAEEGHAFAARHLDTEGVYTRLRAAVEEIWAQRSRPDGGVAR